MAAVQVASFFSLFFLVALAHSQRTFTVDQSDANSVTFTDGWSTVPHSTAIGASFAFTSKPAARVSIALPQGTVAARYIGFQLQSSATYSYCVDCFAAGASNNLLNSTSVQVDGASLNANDKGVPLLLFTIRNLNPSAPHVITVFNPKPQNYITFDAVIAVLHDSAAIPSTLPAAPSKPISVTSTTTPSPISGVLSDPSPTSPPTPPLVPDQPVSTGHSSVTSTLSPPSTTSNGSSSAVTKKGVSIPLVVALTLAAVIILAVVFFVHRHIRRPRRVNPEPESESKSPGDPNGPPIGVVQGQADSTESGVLPTPTIWRKVSFKTPTPRRPSISGPTYSRNVRTPSMLETIHTEADSSGTIPISDNGDPPQTPRNVV